MANNSNNINKTKESLNSDGQQFHQHQQNKRKFKQWWPTIPQTSTKLKTTSHLSSLGTKNKKNTAYGAWNPGHDLEQAQKYGRVKPVK